MRRHPDRTEASWNGMLAVTVTAEQGRQVLKITDTVVYCAGVGLDTDALQVRLAVGGGGGVTGAK